MKHKIIFFLFIIFTWGCSDDRLKPLEKETAVEVEIPEIGSETKGDPEPEPEEIDFKNNTEAFNLFLAQAAKIPVNIDNSMPFVSVNGTQVYVAVDKFVKKKDNSPVSFPVNIELIELFSPGDIILNGKPTVSNGKLLTTGGEIFIRITKDGDEVILKDDHYLRIKIPTKSPDNKMRLFTGEEDVEGNLNWEEEPEWVYIACIEAPDRNCKEKEIAQKTLTVNGDNYELFTGDLGWINCDRFLNDEGSLTTISFESKDTPINAILLYLYFPDINSIIAVNNGVSLQVPIGQNYTYVAYAVSSKDLVYAAWKEGLVVAENQKIELNLEETDPEALLDFLDHL
ncbi:hypothetical protein [Arcticibacterium luteifluviistationis]|uniref:Uncharacterized protein n=1 Tax=Arcticibacterium luteifluviistationis TaxID=1784714 RepID=A0A2Z4GD48_9BACT|nr:hypothetical protein [Arcticibacterium luteifluviistationis]AWV99071.1 hypothetical protein DJ013_13205 [Arcticibacterium luteifluviistationis]